MIRVVLPAHLRTLAGVTGEVILDIDGEVSQKALLDTLEHRYPMLCGTIRDHVTSKRRAYIRFFAGGEDLSHTAPDTLLPDDVIRGEEPFLIVGALSGG
ncbi:MAG: MoaD/ThiS family protein [bacterium]|jgi:molybdopterin synthase sulfur carrier subunit